jgi:nucleoside-diphosphate-sugar epimerase
MRILITGGAGFLGLHLARDLSAHTGSLTLLDIAPFDEREYASGLRLIEGDIRDRELLHDLLSEHRYDVIIHGAAALPLWKPDEIHSVNVDGTRIVLELAREHGVGRVVFVSSTAVYGVPEKHPIEENDPLVGVGPYGESKIEAERVCGEFRTAGYCVPVIRPKTFIGTERLGVFQILYDWVECGTRIPVIGSGRNRYQLLEVEDLVEAIRLASVADDDIANDTFNVGAERFGTVREDVGAMCDHAGTGACVLPTPAFAVKPILIALEAMKLSPLYKWVYGTADKDSWVSVEKAKAKLGWRPKYSNADTLIRSYDWYLQNKVELGRATGITHRVAWDQGALRLAKALLSA